MNKIQQGFVKMCIWISITTFFLRWVIDGFNVNTSVLSVAYQFWSYAGEAILFTTIFMFVYERWAWMSIPGGFTPLFQRLENRCSYMKETAAS